MSRNRTEAGGAVPPLRIMERGTGGEVEQRSRGSGGAANEQAARLTSLLCNRCGFEVPSRAWGCKNPCPNCGTVYPLGDCSD